MKKTLKSFESIKKSIENDICHSEMTMFDECSRDSDNIKSAYKSFQSARF